MIMLQAVNDKGEDIDHLHSIVVKISDGIALIDIQGLLVTLEGTSIPELESKYVP